MYGRLVLIGEMKAFLIYFLIMVAFSLAGLTMAKEKGIGKRFYQATCL